MPYETYKNESSKVRLVSLLESTSSDIGRLSATCCQTNKSERMQALLSTYKSVSQSTKKDSYADHLIEFVESTGHIIGGMHVTCCTPDSEEIYQRLLTQISQFFMLTWRLKGISYE